MRRVLAAAVAALACLGPAGPAAAQPDGENLYLRDCAWCHGPGGAGTNRGPSLAGTGEAEAHYYLSTGRMPIDEPRTPERAEPPYTDEELAALVAYVAGLGDGPALPDVDAAAGDLARGLDLYAVNCAMCHGFSGVGGALSGRAAPPLVEATATETVAAVVAGPGHMPSFDALDEEDLADLAAYVAYLGEPEHPGGWSLGGIGPVAEAVVAVVAAFLLVVVIRWGIAGRRRTA